MVGGEHDIAGQQVFIREIRVNIWSVDHGVQEIISELDKGGASFSTFTLNLDHLVKLQENAQFKSDYGCARFVSADGFPIVLLAKMRGMNIERAAGSDLIVPLCQAMANLDYSIYLFGSTMETLERCRVLLESTYPGLRVAGVFAPAFGFDPDSDQVIEIIKRIENSRARLCFVALGAPKQERFCAKAQLQTRGIGFVGVGAALDFLAGARLRCPRFLIRLNLEWAWRLILEPRRLALRYCRCGLLFIWLLANELMLSGRRIGIRTGQ